MKNRTLNIMIVAFVVIGAMAVSLIVFLTQAHEEFPEKIKVRANGVTEDVLSVRDLALCPTESQSYSVDLVCAASGDYHITLDYEEETDGGMKHFVDVVISSNDTVVYDGTLLDLIDGGTIVEFDGELLAKDPLVITFFYEMPGDVGNEAQATFADFDIRLKVAKN